MLVLERFLGSYDKERPELINMKKPSEVVVAQVNRGRVKGVDLSMELEDVLYPLLLSDPHHVVGELLEDAIVTTVVRFGQVASGDVLAETEYVELVLERSRCYDETSQ